MQEYVIALSRYLLTGSVLCYTMCSMLSWRSFPDMLQKKTYPMQTAMIFMVQIVAFGNLFLISGDKRYAFLFGFFQVFLLTVLLLVPLIYESVNRLLLLDMSMLLGIGICTLSRLSVPLAIKQYIVIMASLTIALLIPFVLSRIRFLKKFTWVYAAVGILLLAVVLILGKVVNGSKLSFRLPFLGGIAFQSSEFVKILFVFFLAGALWKETSLHRILLTSVLAGFHVILLVCSKDLGSSLIFFMAYLLLVFIATRKYLYLLVGLTGGSVAAIIAYHLFRHVQVRVMAWQDPWRYIDNQGYQITQSLFAIGNGGWLGTGIFQGNPKAIPYVESDLIFSAICEEWGLLAGICLLLICLRSFLCMLQIAMQIRDRFYQMIVFGIGVIYIFQIFLTIGGGIKFIPLTGVTLPFVSYGGSSVMASMFMFFLVQGIYIRLESMRSRQVEKGENDDDFQAESNNA